MQKKKKNKEISNISRITDIFIYNYNYNYFLLYRLLANY